MDMIGSLFDVLLRSLFGRLTEIAEYVDGDAINETQSITSIAL